MLAATPEAYQLLHEGAIALAQVEAAGLKIDTEYLQRAIKKCTYRIKDLEDRLVKDDLFKTWKKRFAQKTNLGSLDQLAHILFKVMGLPCYHFTPKSTPKNPIPSAKQEALELVDIPFVQDYMKWRKLSDTKGKYLEGILRETVDGWYHPEFNLHLTSTFRSSSGSDKETDQSSSTRSVNFQNFPVRDPERSKTIRRTIISPDGYCTVEIDFSTIEVRVGCCRHFDPVLIDYVKNSPPKDMHRDTAQEMFFLKENQVDKKTTRDWAKNRFVFPAFYGSVYFQMAPNLWKAIVGKNPEIPGVGKKLLDHLKDHGITELGDCTPGGDPQPGSFARHIKKVEDSLWNKRLTVYRDWKRKIWEQFLRDGAIQTLTGFVIQGWSGKKGMLSRNDSSNHDIQGSSFHCLLKCITLIQKWLKKYKSKAHIVGQIHDSQISYVPEKEVGNFIEGCHDIMTRKLPKLWPWIIVPLEVEPDVSPPGLSWYHKKPWICVNGVWQEK